MRVGWSFKLKFMASFDGSNTKPPEPFQDRWNEVMVIDNEFLVSATSYHDEAKEPLTHLSPDANDLPDCYSYASPCDNYFTFLVPIRWGFFIDGKDPLKLDGLPLYAFLGGEWFEWVTETQEARAAWLALARADGPNMIVGVNRKVPDIKDIEGELDFGIVETQVLPWGENHRTSQVLWADLNNDAFIDLVEINMRGPNTVIYGNAQTERHKINTEKFGGGWEAKQKRKDTVYYSWSLEKDLWCSPFDLSFQVPPSDPRCTYDHYIHTGEDGRGVPDKDGPPQGPIYPTDYDLHNLVKDRFNHFHYHDDTLESLAGVLGEHDGANEEPSLHGAVFDLNNDGLDDIVVHNVALPSDCATRCHAEGRFGYASFTMGDEHCYCGPHYDAMVGPA